MNPGKTMPHSYAQGPLSQVILDLIELTGGNNHHTMSDIHLWEKQWVQLT